MSIITKAEASRLEHAPTSAGLTILSKKNPRPKYFVEHEGKVKVNIESPEWKQLIERRRIEHMSGLHRGGRKTRAQNVQKEEPEKKVRKPKKNQVISNNKDKEEDYDEQIARLSKESGMAQLRKPILEAQKLEYENEMKKSELEKKAGNLIEYSLGEFLFFGYMERINRELLTLPDKIEAIIDTHVKEQNTRGITKEYKHQIEEILITIKKAQAEDVKRWREEN